MRSMLKLIKRLAHKGLERYGYQVLKKQAINPDYKIPLYESLFDKDSLDKKRFYNIGAGGFFHPFWTNVDFYNSWYKKYASNIGIHFDLMKCEALPIESSSAEIVYTSHTIEHITDQAISNMFNEAYRILKPGGCFRITAPDVNNWYRAFQKNDRHFFDDSIAYYSSPSVMSELDIHAMDQASLGSIFQYYFSATTSPLTKYDTKRKFSDEELIAIFVERSYSDALTYICSHCYFDPDKTGYHINWVNAEKVVSMLREAGFSDIYVSAFGQSYSPVLRDIMLFDNTVPEWSCYVEAFK